MGTLMKRMGIAALAPQPGTSKAHPGHKIYPYLLRNLAISRANQVWALDTTCVYLKAYDSVSAARADIAEYFDWYNTTRPHSSLDDQTPDQTYWQLLPMMKMAA